MLMDLTVPHSYRSGAIQTKHESSARRVHCPSNGYDPAHQHGYQGEHAGDSSESGYDKALPFAQLIWYLQDCGCDEGCAYCMVELRLSVRCTQDQILSVSTAQLDVCPPADVSMGGSKTCNGEDTGLIIILLVEWRSR
jgi:hypothetical protein